MKKKTFLFANININATFAPQIRMVRYLSWIEKQPSKLWVLGSNPSPIT